MACVHGALKCSVVLKTAHSRVQCVFLPCGVRVRPPLVFSGTQKLHPLVCTVFFCFFLLPAAYTTPSKRETKKKASPKSTCAWHACKAPSRLQWYPKTASSRDQYFVCCRPHTRARVSEKQKQKRALSTQSRDLHSLTHNTVCDCLRRSFRGDVSYSTYTQPVHVELSSFTM